jgi:hypothetical protein
VIPISERPKLERLYEKYGIGDKDLEPAEPEGEEVVEGTRQPPEHLGF